MSVFAWGLLLCAAQLAAGIAIGRCLPLGRRKSPPADVPQEQGETTLDTAGLRGFATRMHELLASVAGDVDAHQTQIGLVNENLNSVRSQESGKSLTDAMLRLIARITRINEQLQGRIKSSEEKLQEQTDTIRLHLAEARTDPLTQLPNRRAFDDELDRRVAEWTRHKTPCGLMMVDIDHFKEINDRYGHPVGDHALKAIADVLVDTLRDMEIVTRFGGEEFAIVLPATDEAGAMVATERVRQAVEALVIQSPDATVDLTVSSGLAVTCEDDDAASLLARADEALYASKRTGRNRGHFHDSQTCRLIDVEIEHGNAVTAALPADETGETDHQADELAPDLMAACKDLRHRVAEYRPRRQG